MKENWIRIKLEDGEGKPMAFTGEEMLQVAALARKRMGWHHNKKVGMEYLHPESGFLFFPSGEGPDALREQQNRILCETCGHTMAIHITGRCPNLFPEMKEKA